MSKKKKALTDKQLKADIKKESGKVAHESAAIAKLNKGLAKDKKHMKKRVGLLKQTLRRELIRQISPLKHIPMRSQRLTSD